MSQWTWCSSNGYDWSQVSDGPWSRRDDHGLLAYDDRMWLLGGTPAYDNWVYDLPDPQGWKRVGLAGQTVQGLTVRGRQLFAATGAGLFSCSLDAATTSATVWTSRGLAGQSVAALYVHPTVSSTLFAAVVPPDASGAAPRDASLRGMANPLAARNAALSASAPTQTATAATPPPDEPSFFRSRDGGASWQQADAGVHGWRSRALAGTPAADGSSTPTLFLAADGALARSRDGARSWQTVHAQAGWAYAAVACDPTSAAVVWAGGADAAWRPFLLRSRDGGDSWTSLLAGDSATSLGMCVTRIALDARTPGTVRAYCSGCVWQTADGGATHSVVPTALALTWAEAADPADPNHLYGAGSIDDNSNFGFSESTDRAARWLVPGHAREGTSELLSLALDPASPRVAFAGTLGMGILRRVLDPPTTATLRTLTLVAGPHGTTTHWPEGRTYVDGTTVTLTGLAAAHCHFKQWTGDLALPANATQDTMVVTMDRDRTLRADFTIDTFALTTLVSGGGTVARMPDLVRYDAGTTVTLTPLPSPHRQFEHWTGNVPSGHDADDPLALVMDTTRTLTAQFGPEASGWELH